MRIQPQNRRRVQVVFIPFRHPGEVGGERGGFRVEDKVSRFGVINDGYSA